MNHLAECITAPQPNHSADQTTVRVSPQPQFNDMRCVIDRLPVTCSNVIYPLTSQMQLSSPDAMEQLRFRDVIGRVTSPYDVMPLSENGCTHSSVTAKVNRVVAHARHRRDDLTEGVIGVEMLKSENRRSSMDEEISLEDAEVLALPVPSVRGKWWPLVERNNNSQNISLNAISSSSSSCSPHPLDDDEVHHLRRMNVLPVLRPDHFDEINAKEEQVWRPW